MRRVWLSAIVALFSGATVAVSVSPLLQPQRAASAVPTITVDVDDADQQLPEGTPGDFCEGRPPTSFATPTRLVAGPYVVRITRPFIKTTNPSMAKHYYVMLFRLNRDPLNCVNHSRGYYTIKGQPLGDGMPEKLNRAAVQRASRRHCFIGVLWDDGPPDLRALDRVPVGGRVPTALRPYTRRDNGTTAPALRAIRRVVRLREARQPRLADPTYRAVVRALRCSRRS